MVNVQLPRFWNQAFLAFDKKNLFYYGPSCSGGPKYVVVVCIRILDAVLTLYAYTKIKINAFSFMIDITAEA